MGDRQRVSEPVMVLMTTAHAGGAVRERTGGQDKENGLPYDSPRRTGYARLETKAMVAGHLEKTIVQQSPRANRRVKDGRKGDHE
jgi:hypothetical protein